MKLKGISKLVLAGTALAATAATLTTATYAWYVTNTTVSATGVSGSVAGSSIDGSLFIAKNKLVSEKDAPDTYVTKIQLSKAANTGYTLPDNGLDPQSKAIKIGNDYYFVTNGAFDSSKTYYTIAGSTPAATEADIEAFAADTVYYEKSTKTEWVGKDGKKTGPYLLSFKFWLKSSAAGTAAITVKADNTTTTAVPQTALTGTGLPSSVNQGDQFTVDAMHALRMEITQTNYLNGVAGTTTSNVYQVDELAKGKDGASKYSTAASTAATRQSGAITFATGGDANAYYFAILDEIPYGTGASGASTDSKTGTAPEEAVALTLEANNDTLLEFNVWLEGSDADCFDSCRGQSFTFDFDFAFTAA